jgi:ABC-type nitrate/sulfonate/bicarbonate transport system substrate-binding protein
LKYRRNIIFLFFVVLALMVSSGTACRQQQKQTGTPERITIAYSTAPNAALVHIAFVKGYFGEEGLEAIPQPHAFGKVALDAVSQGRADVATAADTPIMFAVMEGRKISTFAVIQTANMNEAIVARQDRGIRTPSDLKGKTIGTTLGTAGDFFMDTILITYGIDRRQVRVVDMRPDEMGSALRAGKVDAISAWNPVPTQLQKELGSKVRTFYGETVYTEMFGAVAGQDFITNHPEAIKKFLRALIKAERFVKEQPAEARRLVAEFTGADRAIIEEIWGVYSFKVTLDQALVVDLEDQTRWAQKNGLTRNAHMPDYLDFMYCDGLQSVKPDGVRIIR